MGAEVVSAAPMRPAAPTPSVASTNNGEQRGLLYVVPTPIGNMADISLRALDVLKTVNLVAAEDPRVTRHLLDQYAITTELHTYTGQPSQIDSVMVRLASGYCVALVCDAGTPAIADPGAALISAAIHDGHRVTALPGPMAAIVALIASGFPTNHFAFDGFPPRGRADRKAYFASLAGERRTLILYESAAYLRSTLRSLHRFLPARCGIAIASNLTTPHEAVWRGDLSAALQWVGQRPPRGSYTLVLACSM
jgi:16S rRNA (cytidine1402-2'-O)-methyltransferase